MHIIKTIGSLFLVGAIAILNQAMGIDIDYKALYQNTAPSVVMLYGTDGKTGAAGTGSIIDDAGLVLTNTHVVANGKELWKKQYVILKPEKVTGNDDNDLKKMYQAKVLALHEDYDLALVQIVNPPPGLKPIPLSDLRHVGIGEPTVAIGHPAGGAPWSLTTGKVSASFEDYRRNPGWDIYQTETSLNPGNSGGPLLDGSGAVIGINTFIVRKGSGGLALTGLNFAVKSTVARQWIEEVMGRLPDASELKPEAQAEAPKPDAGEIQQAPPPEPKEEKPEGFVEKAKKKRESRMEEAPERSEEKYETEVEPGREFTESEVMAYIKKQKADFENFKSGKMKDFQKFLKSKQPSSE